MTQPLWFFDELVHIRISRDETGDRFSVLEIAVPPASTPPLHVHHTEDEAFYVLEGSARFHVGSDVQGCRRAVTRSSCAKASHTPSSQATKGRVSS